MSKRIEKPWGWEEIIEQNAHYVLKKLFMRAGEQCSLQYHKEKIETVFVLVGLLEIMDCYSNVIMFETGEYITILPPKIHKMKAHLDTVYLEASTPQLDDVVRLEDKYGRV